jgi:hypothetical protein
MRGDPAHCHIGKAFVDILDDRELAVHIGLDRFDRAIERRAAGALAANRLGGGLLGSPG